jgi:hypothetical protein
MMSIHNQKNKFNWNSAINVIYIERPGLVVMAIPSPLWSLSFGPKIAGPFHILLHGERDGQPCAFMHDEFNSFVTCLPKLRGKPSCCSHVFNLTWKGTTEESVAHSIWN